MEDYYSNFEELSIDDIPIFVLEYGKDDNDDSNVEFNFILRIVYK